MPASPSAERARRMLALLPYLRAQGRRPLSELASLSRTDVETVAADLTALSLCGAGDANPDDLVAVLVEDGEAIVFGELPALRRPVRLTDAESRALVAALDACGASPDSELVRRLTHMAGGAEADDPARTIRAAEAPAEVVHTLIMLAACASAHRVARVTYTPLGAGAPTERIVHPWRLFSARGVWYLQAWSAQGGEHGEGERTLRLDRIASVAPTDATFEPPADLPAEVGASPDPGSLPSAGILFAHDAPDLNERSWPGATFDRRADGTVLAQVPYAGTGWIARKVAARLGDAVVTGPDDVREAVERLARDELARIAAEEA